MRPKGYPACVLFSLVVAASFLGMGRVASCSVHSARTSPLSVATPRWAGLTPGLKPRTPDSIRPLLSDLTTRACDPQHNCNRGTAAAKAAHPCGAKVVAGATTYLDTRVHRTTVVPGASVSLPFVPAAYPPTKAVSANFSLPIAFAPAGGAARQAVRYVGRGKGMTVLLESGGIELVAGGGAVPNPAPDSVQLRWVNSGAAQSTATGTPRNGAPSTPTRHRRRRSGAPSKPRTLQRHNRQNMPRHDPPSHKGQAPLRQRPPGQRLPREAKPTSQLTTPPASRAKREKDFAWQGVARMRGESNYFLGSDPAKWRTPVKHFAAEEAKNVVPGLDIVASGNALLFYGRVEKRDAHDYR
jgi:hypothetical protein